MPVTEALSGLIHPITKYAKQTERSYHGIFTLRILKKIEQFNVMLGTELVSVHCDI